MNQGKNRNKIRSAAKALPAIDWRLCLKLANNKETVAQEILLLIIQELPTNLKAIQQAQEKADYHELLRCVHKLHGSLCYCGMPRLKNAVILLEIALRNKVDEAQLTELRGHLETEAKTILTSPLPR